MSSRPTKPTDSPSLHPQITSDDTPPAGNGGARLLPYKKPGQDTEINIEVRTKSSWISSIKYRERGGYLAIFINNSHAPVCNGEPIPVAMLYSNVPIDIYNMIASSPSPGKMYNVVLKNKEIQDKYNIQYQRIEGREKVNELRKLMES